MEKENLFETTAPTKALAVMALPTVASQLILLLYNLADTWFIGRTNDPYMVAASSLALTAYLVAASIANVFGVGGGSLMARLKGEKRLEDARKVVSCSVACSLLAALAFSVLTLLFMTPLLRLLGATERTLAYGKQYLFATTVLGAVPTVLSMSMPQLLRNAGHPKAAGFGVALGSLLNILLDPLFMFVLLPKGNEVLGAAVATLLSNVVSMVYFIAAFRRFRDDPVLALPVRLERIGKENVRSLYSVGIPAAFSIFLFDLVTIVINRLTVAYGDVPLAAMGIVLKLERIPLYTGLGVCLGMVPLVAYNYGAGNRPRMARFFSLTRVVILVFSCVCAAAFWFFAEPIVGAFIADEETVRLGSAFLRGRCFALPFMMIGYHIVNYMNAVGRGRISFLLAVTRHIVLIVPILLLMNRLWGMTGLTWAQLAADLINSVLALAICRRLNKTLLAPDAP